MSHPFDGNLFLCLNIFRKVNSSKATEEGKEWGRRDCWLFTHTLTLRQPSDLFGRFFWCSEQSAPVRQVRESFHRKDCLHNWQSSHSLLTRPCQSFFWSDGFSSVGPDHQCKHIDFLTGSGDNPTMSESCSYLANYPLKFEPLWGVFYFLCFFVFFVMEGKKKLRKRMHSLANCFFSFDGKSS